MFCILYIIIKIGNRMIYDVNISLCFSLRPLRLCGSFFFTAKTQRAQRMRHRQLRRVWSSECRK